MCVYSASAQMQQWLPLCAHGVSMFAALSDVPLLFLLRVLRRRVPTDLDTSAVTWRELEVFVCSWRAGEVG